MIHRLPIRFWRFWPETWALTAALAGAMVLVFFAVDQTVLTSYQLRSPTFSALVLLVGVLLLTGRQGAVLGALFLALELWYLTTHRDPLVSRDLQGLLLRRSLFFLLCIWLARVRSQLAHQRHELKLSRDELRGRLMRSLQAASLIHELRQPLSALMLQTRLVRFQLEQGREDTATLNQQLEDLEVNGSRINEVTAAIQRLLSPNPAEKALSCLDLAALLRQCLRNRLESLTAAGIALEQEGLAQPHQVDGDPIQLEIAIFNLIRNAAEALASSPASGRRLLVQLHSSEQEVVLSVADSGPGLPADQLELLLLRSSKSEGMGLGLHTVQLIASRHGGSLSLGRSAALGGAELRLILPAAADVPSAGSGRAWPVAPVPRR